MAPARSNVSAESGEGGVRPGSVGDPRVGDSRIPNERRHRRNGTSGSTCHRGWLYSVAVDESMRRKRVGSALIRRAVDVLRGLGCVKVNLQVRSTNAAVVAFYEWLGFAVDDRISM